MDVAQFRAELKRVMEKKRLNQVDLSRMTGVPQPCISRFLAGDQGLRMTHTLALLTYIGAIRHRKPTAQPDAGTQAPADGNE